MVAVDVVHPDQEVVDVQAGPQNERNTAGEAPHHSRWTSGDPVGWGDIRMRSVVRRARAHQLRRRDSAGLRQCTAGKLSGSVLGEGAGVHKLIRSVVNEIGCED